MKWIFFIAVMLFVIWHGEDRPILATTVGVIGAIIATLWHVATVIQ